MAKSSLQRPIRHWSEDHRKVRTSNGQVFLTPRHEATEFVFVEFFCNLFTACLLVYWLTVWGGIFDHVIFGGILALGIMFQQHDSFSRWPVRFVVWGIFWGMYHFGLHWVPLVHF